MRPPSQYLIKSLDIMFDIEPYLDPLDLLDPREHILGHRTKSPIFDVLANSGGVIGHKIILL